MKQEKILEKKKYIYNKTSIILLKRQYTTILVDPNVLVEFGYKYGSNKIHDNLLALDEATIISGNKVKHKTLNGIIIPITLRRDIFTDYNTANKALELMITSKSRYVKSNDEKGLARSLIVLNNIVRFAGKNTFIKKYNILKYINKLKKENKDITLEEVKKELLTYKPYVNYLKKFNNYNPATIVKNINKTAKENEKIKSESFKIKNIDKLKQFIEDKENELMKLEEELLYTESSLYNKYDNINELLLESLTKEECAESASRLSEYFKAKKENKKDAKNILIKRNIEILRLLRNKIAIGITNENTIKKYLEYTSKSASLRQKRNKISKEIDKIKNIISISSSILLEQEMLGKVYFNNHFTYFGRDYNEMANLKKEIRNIILEGFTEFDITNTAYYMFYQFAKLTNQKHYFIKLYLEKRNELLKIFGSQLKIDMLRLFNSNETNKKRIVTKYKKLINELNLGQETLDVIVLLMEGLYQELMKLKTFIIENGFTFKTKYITEYISLKNMENVNDKNILSIFYMKLESIIIEYVKNELKKKNIDVVRVHDGIFYDCNDKKIIKNTEKLFNELLDFNIIL